MICWERYPCSRVGFLFIFLIHCSLISLEIPSKTYSQKDSNRVPFDHKLARIMNFKNGTFIEVGAYTGLVPSNTKLLEDSYEWTGILIEPFQEFFTELCKNRPNAKCFQCALGSFKEDNTYAYGCFNGGPMSGFQSGHTGNEKVLMRSLQSVLDECELQHINFFSLDVEGYEFNVLKGIDFDRTTFDYLLIEIRNNHYKEIVSFLYERGYDLMSCFSNYNRIDNPGWDGTHNDYLFKRRRLD